MRFSVSALLFVLPAVLAAPTSQLEARDKPSDIDCIEYSKYVGMRDNRYFPECASLSLACAQDTKSNADMWSIATCVAAATCDGTVGEVIVSQCGNNDIPSAASLPNLNYDIYASIVGDCAWQEGGCPITQQNYIDFYYGALSAINTQTWPDVNNVIQYFWQPMLEWANTGDSIPYTNFNDWLHYSNTN